MDSHQPTSPDKNTSFFGSLFFCWAVPFLRNQKEKELTIEDIYRVRSGDQCDVLTDRLNHAWVKELRHHRKQPSLFRALSNVFCSKFLLLGLVYFVTECLIRIGEGVIMGMFLRYFSGEITETEAWYLGGTLIIISAAYNTMGNPMVFWSFHLGFQMRVACSGLVYRKALRLSQSSLRKTDTGQLINLLSSDVERMDVPIDVLNALWIAPIMLIIVISILWSHIGSGALVAIAILAIFVPLQGVAGLLYGRIRGRIAVKTDARLKILAEIIYNIKLIKMNAWEFIFMKKVGKTRDEELKEIRTKMYTMGGFLGLETMTSRIIVLLSLLAFVNQDGWLSPEKVYVTLYLFEVCTGFMVQAIPYAISMLAEVNVSINRLQEFLQLEELKKNNIRIQKDESDIGRIGVSLRNVTSYGTSFNLKNISFDLCSGQVIGIVGTVGSGKTSILEAILGELPLSKGQLDVRGSIAYSVQEPWIMNGTVRENILFGEEYIYDWFRKVIESCALDLDLSTFPIGDMTLVGDKGITLSEGQKARVNLARSVYANADIYLLDDPFSSVDVKIGRIIFDKCILGVLANKCVLLVTHQPHYLQNVNQIIVMNNGKIQASMTCEGIATRLLLPNEILRDVEDFPNSEIGSLDFVSDHHVNDILRTNAIDKKENLEHGYGASKIESSPTVDTWVNEVGAKGIINFWLAWTYLRFGNSFPIVLFAIFNNIFAYGLLNTSNYYLQLWTDAEETSNQHEKGAMEYLHRRHYLKWIYTTIVLITFIASTSSAILFFNICIKSGTKLHNALTKAVIRAPLQFFERNPIGRILNRFSKDIGLIDDEVSQRLYHTFTRGVQVFGSLVLVCIMCPWLIFPTVIVLIILKQIREHYMITATRVRRMEGIALSPVYSLLSTTIGGLRTIRAFKAEEKFVQQFNSAQDIHSSLWYTSLALSTWFSMTIEWVLLAYYSVVILVFLLLGTSGAQVGLALSEVLVMNGLLSAILKRTTSLQNDLVAVERVVEYTRIGEEGQLESKQGRIYQNGWPSKGEIRMENISVKYDAAGTCVLKNINLVINPKEKIGIVGRTGVGKSTFISTLFRFIQPSSGRVLIDGVDISTIGLHDLRSILFMIPQNQGFFTGSLRSNLDVTDSCTSYELWSALNKVQLIKRVQAAGGLESYVGENGNNFSVGERQLLFFARAILTDKKIIVFDEATASMDQETDAVIRKLIQEKFNDCTVLTIAHRLKTVMECDRICVFDDGRIVEFDAPKNLLQNPSGYLPQLVRQTKTIEPTVC